MEGHLERSKMEYFPSNLFGNQTQWPLGRKSIKMRSKSEIAELVQTLRHLQNEVNTEIGAINQRLGNVARKGMCCRNCKTSFVAKGGPSCSNC